MIDAAKEAMEIAQRLVRIHGFERCADHLDAIAAEIEPEIRRRMEAEERRAETVAMCQQFQQERLAALKCAEEAEHLHVLTAERMGIRRRVAGHADEGEVMAEKTAAERVRAVLDLCIGNGACIDCDNHEPQYFVACRFRSVVDALEIALEALEYYEARITLKCAREAIERMAEVLEGR